MEATVLCVSCIDGFETKLTAALDDVSVLHVDGLAEAERVLAEESVDFVVSAYDVVDGDGVDVFDYVQKQFPDVPVVIFDADIPDGDIERPEHVLSYDPEFEEDAFRRLAVTIKSAVDVDVPTLYPVPEDEEQRLEIVSEYNISDLDAEESFERITEIAQKLFDVEMSFFGIVGGEEENLFACQGFDGESIPREDAICTFTILEDAVMVVEDLHEDERFRDNDTVESMGIQWYAGAPLITPEGARIGTLCLLDTEPQEFTSEDEKLLELLADELVEQLVLRKRIKEQE